MGLKCDDPPVTVATRVYSASELPQSLTWQALSFLRCEWPFLFAGDGRLRARPFCSDDAWCVARADGDVLLSYAEVLRVTAMRADVPVRVLGLSNVFTFPPYRGERHASAIMHAVGELINGSDAEMAILFCELDLVSFYSARSWQLAPEGSIEAPGTAPATMVRAGRGHLGGVDRWLADAPVLLVDRW